MHTGYIALKVHNSFWQVQGTVDSTMQVSILKCSQVEKNLLPQVASDQRKIIAHISSSNPENSNNTLIVWHSTVPALFREGMLSG